MTHNILWILLDAIVSFTVTLGFKPKDGRPFKEWWVQEGFAFWLIAAGTISMGILAFLEF
jgi:hypothetical protein